VTALHRSGWWVACLVTVLLAGWGVWTILTAAGPGGGPPALPAPVLTGPAPSSPARSGPRRIRRGTSALGRSAPSKIVIPSIGLRAAVDDIGLERDGTIETPPYAHAHRAAWYRRGVSPGEPGPAVILGHVDSTTRVAVFFYLTRVRPGDRIEVVRADRRTVIFVVASIERFAKSEFPTARVYGPTGGPELRLITCGGRYDPRHRAYLDNVVVFAHLVDIRNA
jgi:hypothetical protein